MTESTPGPSIADEGLIADIAAKNGNAAESPFANLTSTNAVGQVLLLDYDAATLAVHDYHRERAGGLARGMFLISGSPPSKRGSHLCADAGGRGEASREPDHHR